MSITETPKYAANAAAAVAPLASYLSGISAVITILAGIASLIWLGSSLWKLYFPEHFHNFVKRINRKE